MLDAIYLLCAATALACAVLLLRSWRRTGARLLFWSGLCFVGLMLENVLMLVDLWVVPDINLLVLRRSVALAGVAALVYGLVWETR